MGLDDLPEIKIARRFTNSHSLTIPFDLAKQVRNYATLVYKEIPIPGVDGVSVNLKIPSKTPTIIVNTKMPEKRQLFTLAHELGHIIIPWHIGTIVDEIYPQTYKQNYYFELEQEANRFAAEILMPKDWVNAEYKKNEDNLSKLHLIISEDAGVSLQAAAIRLTQILPQNYIFIAVESGLVSYTGKTSETYPFLQEEGSYFDDKFYPHFDHYSSHNKGGIQYHWWKISSKINLDTKDHRPWREILDDIAMDINPPEGIDKLKKTISGIIGFANGKEKLHGNYTIDSVIAASIHRLRRPELKEFISHPKFESFIKIKVEDIFNK